MPSTNIQNCQRTNSKSERRPLVTFTADDAILLYMGITNRSITSEPTAISKYSLLLLWFISCDSFLRKPLHQPSWLNYASFGLIPTALLMQLIQPEVATVWGPNLRLGVSNDLGVAIVLSLLFLKSAGMTWDSRLLLTIASQIILLVLILSIFILFPNNGIWLSVGLVLITSLTIVAATSVVYLPTLGCFWLLWALPRSFSLGEAFIISLILANSILAAISVLVRLGPFTKLIEPASTNLGIFAALVFLSSILAIIITTSVLPSGVYAKYSLLFAYVLIGSLLFTVARPSPVLALKELRTPGRLSIFISWAALLLIIVSLSVIFLVYCPAPSKLQLHLIRKFYHLMAVLLFLSVLFSDPKLLRVALIFVGTAFISLEAFRLLCPDTVPSKFLTPIMERFRNKLDAGDAVLSHFWLLLGCAIPVLIAGNGHDPASKLKAMSGILSLGLLDAVAALSGLWLGGPQWPNSSKTIVGSICGLVALVFGHASVLWYYLPTHSISWGPLILQAFYCAVWEATSDLNDNISLPLFAHITADLIFI